MSERRPVDPFAVLGVSPSADDAAIRRAYLGLLRLHRPERDPEGFQRVRAAYEAVRSGQDRAARRLLESPELPDVDDVLRGLAETAIPSEPRQINRALRIAVLNLLPQLRISDGDLGPVPDELPEEAT